jgi:hypothetical protein
MTDENVHQMWSEEELDQALAALNTEVPPGAMALAAARTELMTAAGAPPVSAKRHWGRWAGIGVTVAAGITIAALVVQEPVVRTVNVPVSPAAQVLNGAADKIGSVDPVVRPGQYLYVETHSWVTGTVQDVTFLEESLIQEWVPADRTQEWLLRSTPTGKRKFLLGTEEDLKALGPTGRRLPNGDARGRCGDFHLQPGEQPCRQHGSWQRPTTEFFTGLPTDPHALYDRLRADTKGHGQDPDVEMVVYVTDALRSGLAPAPVRANLYRALALMPSLQVVDQQANLDGRAGVALGVDGGGTRDEMIIDPGTGQFIGERSTATQADRGLPAGTVTGFSSVTTRVADTIGDKPAR